MSRKVFLDSDDLDKLDHLFQTVAHDVEHLLVIGTKDIFLRPWCIGEMTIARLNTVKVTILALPDWQLPDETTTKAFDKLVDMRPLVKNNISLRKVWSTLKWIHTLPVIKIPTHLSTSILKSLIEELVSHAQQRDIELHNSQTPTSVQPKTYILADDTDMEAIAAAHYLMQLMLPHTMHNAQEVPSVLLASNHAPVCVQNLVVMCTKGCLDQPDFLSMLWHAWTLEANFLPVVVDANFRFPSMEFLANLYSRSCPVLGADGSQLADMIAGIFHEIAAKFEPQSAPDALLLLEAEQIVGRMMGCSVKSLGPSLLDSEHLGSESLCSLAHTATSQSAWGPMDKCITIMSSDGSQLIGKRRSIDYI